MHPDHPYPTPPVRRFSLTVSGVDQILTRSSVRAGLLFITIALVTIALANAVALQYIIQDLLTDTGPNSLMYSIGIMIAASFCFAGVLVVFPTARRSVHGDVYDLGLLFFATIAWINMIWGGFEGVTTPLVPLSLDAALYVISATVLCCFAETFTSAKNRGSRFQTAARNSIFYAGIAGWMLTGIFALFGAFLTDFVVTDLVDETSASVRSLTAAEMKNLVDCHVGESTLVLCRLPQPIE